MLKRKDRIKYPDYWIEGIQNELYRQIDNYMQVEGLNRSQLASKWKVSKGYISQILNGNFNFTLRKLVELSINMGKVPILTFQSFESYMSNMSESETLHPIEITIFPYTGGTKFTLTDISTSEFCIMDSAPSLTSLERETESGEIRYNSPKCAA